MKREHRPTGGARSRPDGRAAVVTGLLILLVAALGLLPSCKRLIELQATDGDPVPQTITMTGGGTTNGEQNETPPPAASVEEVEVVQVPEGYVRMEVLRVVETEHGNAVLLSNGADARLLPIFVGGTEALSIRLRHANHRYPRPLTHDLLDSIVDKLGGRVVKVHVEDVHDNVFIGRVFVRQAKQTVDVDARPSDAIALSMGSRVPIFVAKRVLDTAGLQPQELHEREEPPEMPAPEQPSSEPTQL